ncbi:MAG: endo-1,4-beta-xylanase [Clostridia bacterium]|nr:endo-1,4-beta-xylanase [Clostridia bacterium]
MKRILSVLLVLCMLLPLVPAAAEDESEIFYISDFSENTGAWYARGDETRLTVSDGMLHVSGRKKKTDTAVLDLQLKDGLLYSFTAEIVQNAKSSVEFSMTVERKKNGSTSYTNLGKVKVSKGETASITGEWLAEKYDSYAFYISTVGTSAVDFSLVSLSISVSDPYHLTAVTWEGELPSLKETFADYFDFGTCVSQADVRDGGRTVLIRKHYNILTPENELKPDSVLDVTASKRLVKEQNDDTAVAVRFGSAKPILDFARNNGMKVHGHVLVWHSQTPEEFFHVGYDRKNGYVTREVMLARLENYIRQVFEYMDENYPGLIVSWDVANECVADGSSSLRASNWTKVVGNDFVNRAFEYADKYAPEGVKLFYNDYSTPYEPKLTGIVNLLSSLVAEGHIDGYGFQSHYQSDTPSVSEVKKAFDRISALGLSLRISELDIAVTADTDKTREVQSARYTELMKLWLGYADKLDAVQVWGVSDGTSWIKEKYPLPFDARLQPKPAFFGIVDALK